MRSSAQPRPESSDATVIAACDAESHHPRALGLRDDGSCPNGPVVVGSRAERRKQVDARR